MIGLHSNTGRAPRRHRRTITCFGRWMGTISLGVVLLAGCGNQSPIKAPVKGTVIYDGKPLTTGTILFFPESEGPYATGVISADGTFQLTTEHSGDGAVLGRHRVAISAVASSDPELPSAPLIPVEYGSPSTSGLTAEVLEVPENVIDFTLEPKKGRRSR